MQVAHEIIFTGMPEPISDHLVHNPGIDQRAIARYLDHRVPTILKRSPVMSVQQVARITPVTIQTLRPANPGDHIIFRVTGSGDDDAPAKPACLYPLRLAH